jgi:hypothetical protein
MMPNTRHNIRLSLIDKKEYEIINKTNEKPIIKKVGIAKLSMMCLK